MKVKNLATLLFSSIMIATPAFASFNHVDKNTAALVATTMPAQSQQVPIAQSGAVGSYQILADDPQMTNEPGNA